MSFLFVFPAFLQNEGRIFRLTFSGEDTLLVSVDAEDAFGRLEIRKVPHQFTLNEIIGVKDLEILFQVFALVFL